MQGIKSSENTETPVVDYQQASKTLTCLSQNPLTFLSNLSNTLDLKAIYLSPQEKEDLIEKLKGLKQAFCNRSKHSVLVLPLLATVCLGLKTLFDYAAVNYSKEVYNSSFFLSGIHTENVNIFMTSLCLFIGCLGCSILLEMEHSESVSSLFSKEEKLEQKIDKLITKLQQ